MKLLAGMTLLVLTSSAGVAQEAAVSAEASSTAPAAPTQTIEGARRFLNLLAEDGHLVFHRWNKTGHMVSYKATSVDLAQCRSTFAGTPFGYPDVNGNWVLPISAAWTEAQFHARVAERAIPTPPYTLEWSKISGIGLYKPSQYDSERAVAISSSDEYLYLTLPTPDMAKRVRYAAEFIKAACDRTADTGF